MIARSSSVVITYKGKDISRSIAPYLTQFTFTDNSGGSADDIAITLQDRQGLWLDAWFPAKGDIITCSIISQDSNAHSLPCGVYQVDQIDYSSPPRTISIKAVSTAVTKGLIHEKHSKAWENSTLQAIAADIANDNGLALFFDAEDIQIERREQIHTSDLEFIKALCSDYDLAVKVNQGKLIIFDEERYEAKDSVAELDASDNKIISWRFSSKTAKVYKKARVKYHHPSKNETFEAEEVDDSVEGSERILESNDYAESQADAKNQARKKLLQANRNEISGSITLMGDFRFRAGVNITAKGFGAFSGKYSLSKVTHSLGNGYTTTLELKQGTAAKKASKTAKKKKQTSSAPLYYTGDNYYGRSS